MYDTHKGNKSYIFIFVQTVNGYEELNITTGMGKSSLPELGLFCEIFLALFSIKNLPENNTTLKIIQKYATVITNLSNLLQYNVATYSNQKYIVTKYNAVYGVYSFATLDRVPNPQHILTKMLLLGDTTAPINTVLY